MNEERKFFAAFAGMAILSMGISLLFIAAVALIIKAVFF